MISPKWIGFGFGLSALLWYFSDSYGSSGGSSSGSSPQGSAGGSQGSTPTHQATTPAASLPAPSTPTTGMISTEAQQKIVKILALIETGGYDFGMINRLNPSVEFSYGILQASHQSGSLAALLRLYISMNGAYSAKFAAIPDLRSDDLVEDEDFYNLLKQASSDPVMQAAQMRYFSENYLRPAFLFAESIGLRRAVSYLICARSFVNSGNAQWVRDSITSRKASDELAWMRNYLAWRKGFVTNTLKNNNVGEKMISYVQKVVDLQLHLVNTCPDLNCPVSFIGKTV